MASFERSFYSLFPFRPAFLFLGGNNQIGILVREANSLFFEYLFRGCLVFPPAYDIVACGIGAA
jgi:hypothetical protein